MKIRKQEGILPAMLAYHDGSKASLFAGCKFHVSALQFQSSVHLKTTIMETFSKSNLHCHWLVLYRFYFFHPELPGVL